MDDRKRSRRPLAAQRTDPPEQTPGVRRASVHSRLALAALVALLPSSALAIPSPDLVINLSASIAQLAGLFSILLGGVAVSRGRRASDGGRRRQRPSARWRWVFRGTLVLLVLSVCVNVFQHTRQLDEKNRRLQTNLHRSSVEEGKQVGDTSLKTLSFSEQVHHPLGMETDELARWLAEGRDVNVIDVREPEEVEMGRIASASHARYPDLRMDPSPLDGEGETVLLCYSGNRSSELCQQFAADGRSCRFVVGGYEKWMAEERELVDVPASSDGVLRALPAFENDATLLQTGEVVELVLEERATVLDVRYPGDYEKGHIPDAVNIPVRRMPSAELDLALSSLPDTPIVAACYDRRSCFYSQIAGLRLTRLGYDYRGRYTVPHEFYLPRKEKSFVAEWRQAQEGRTVLGMVSGTLGEALDWLRDLTGHYAAAIALLVLAIRLLLVPFAWKVERDQCVQRALAPRVAALRDRFGQNSAGYTRAVLDLHREHGLRPVLNTLSSLFQLGLFLVFFSVVVDAAGGWSERFLWLDEPGSKDPLYVLAGLVGLLFAGFLLYTIRERTRVKVALSAVAALAVAGLALTLAAAANVYLIMNLGLLLLQSMVFKRFTRRVTARLQPSEGRRPRRRRGGILPLAEAGDGTHAGQKAARLASMLHAGLPVPDGFVVTLDVVETGDGGGEWRLSRAQRAAVDRQWRRLGAKQVAVRSSGLNEDGERASYAGVFESILGVDRDGFEDALAAVRASLSSEVSAAYSGNDDEKGAVLVQAMVPAEYAGVLFTEHPASAGCCLVELVEGLGEDLVGGKVTADPFRFGRLSGEPLDDRDPPIDLQPLIALGREIEALFGEPQDIEWAYARGRFQIVQARTITVCAGKEKGAVGDIERERRRLLELMPAGVAADEPVLVQNELSELLPNPTRLSSSLMERLWSAGGSTDIACRTLGIPYDVDSSSTPYVTTVFGALYVNRAEERRRLRKGPGFGAAFRLARGAESLEADFREGFLPGFLRKLKLQSVVALDKLDDKTLVELLERWIEEFVTDTYVNAELINLATDFYWKTACQKLEKTGNDPAIYLGQMPETIVSRAMTLLASRHKGPEHIRDFLELFGHRAPEDYELSQPRYHESPELLIQQANRASLSNHAPAGSDDLPADAVLRLVVDRARRFQALKEEAKHHCLLQLAQIRRVLVEIDRRLGLDGGIFHLSIDEAVRLRAPLDSATIVETIARRESETRSWRHVRLPSELSILDLESFERRSGGVRKRKPGTLQGTRVAGEGDVVGRVRVLRDPSEVSTLERGEIVVARLTDPSWYPVFPVAGGIVTEVGSWLSHAAIVAREVNITAIVGVRGASDVLQTGQTVRLTTSGRVEIVEQAPQSRRVAAAS